MTEQLAPEKVSTADLKNWVESIPAQPAPHASLRDWVAFIDAREKAWRAAYMWLSHGDGMPRCGAKYAEGIALVQERLV